MSRSDQPSEPNPGAASGSGKRQKPRKQGKKNKTRAPLAPLFEPCLRMPARPSVPRPPSGRMQFPEDDIEEMTVHQAARSPVGNGMNPAGFGHRREAFANDARFNQQRLGGHISPEVHGPPVTRVAWPAPPGPNRLLRRSTMEPNRIASSTNNQEHFSDCRQRLYMQMPRAAHLLNVGEPTEQPQQRAGGLLPDINQPTQRGPSYANNARTGNRNVRGRNNNRDDYRAQYNEYKQMNARRGDFI